MHVLKRRKKTIIFTLVYTIINHVCLLYLPKLQLWIVNEKLTYQIQ